MKPFSPRFLALAAVCLLLGLSSLHAESGWQIIKIDNREYLSLENVARFYQLQGSAHTVDNRLSLGDSRVRLETTGDPRELYINGIKQRLSFPMIIQSGQLLLTRFDLAKTVEPCLRPTMIENLQAFHTVVLDAGHGGQDCGARSVSGYEKDYTLSVIRSLKRSLESKGFRVVTTRDTDVYVPLDGRARQVNDTKDSILVSVHFNSCNDGGRSSGFEVFSMTPRGAASTGDNVLGVEQFQNMPGNDFDNASLALATCVHHSLLGHLPETDRGVKRARFVVLKNTHASAVLVEGGFLTNPTEGARINDEAWRQSLAESIAQGVQSYAALAGRKQPPKLLADYRSEQLPLNGTIINPNAAVVVNTVEQTGAVVAVSNEGSFKPANALNGQTDASSSVPPER